MQVFRPICYLLLDRGIGSGQRPWLCYRSGALPACFSVAFSRWVPISSTKTFRDPNDLQRSLGANVIAHVPRFQITRKEKQAVKDSALAAVCRTALAPHSTESEIIRMARTSLFLHAGQTLHKVFLVTSPMPGDGKSTMIVNIAAAIAKAGKRVLLIDADMRRPTLHKLLGVRNEKGLAEYLMGEADLDEATCPTEVEGLDFIEHGHHASSPAELLGILRSGTIDRGGSRELRLRLSRFTSPASRRGIR